jgi:molybdate transport repressor ModE-like protein
VTVPDLDVWRSPHVTMKEPPSTRSGAPRKADPALRLRLPELEAFLMVAKCGSFSEAARELNLTQPAVTARVQRLEAILKTQLLDRKPRGVTCTDGGKRLLDAGEAALRNLRQLARELVEEAESDRNVVTVAATPAISSLFLVPLIRAFSARHGVSVDVRDMSREEVLASVKEGPIDFAIAGLDEVMPAFEMEKFAEMRFVVAAPRDSMLARHTIADFEDLSDYVQIQLNDYHALNARIEAEFERRRLTLKSRKAQNLTTQLALVNSGIGIALVPEPVLRSSTYDNIKALELRNFHEVRRLWLVRQAKAVRVPASLFWNFLLEARPLA